VVSTRPVELLSVTHHDTDYLWYTANVTITQQQVNSRKLMNNRWFAGGSLQISQGVVRLGLSNVQDYLYIYLDQALKHGHKG
jgi:hypothetical protein